MNDRFHPYFNPILLAAVLCCLLVSAGFMTAPEALAGDNVTISAQKMPLGDVLDEISRNTGKKFILDPDWRDYPVTANLNNMPMDKALKRLLDNLNCAVVYGTDNTVKVLIYGEETKSSGRASPPVRKAAKIQPPPPVAKPVMVPPSDEEAPESEEEVSDEDDELDEDEEFDEDDEDLEDDEEPDEDGEGESESGGKTKQNTN